MEKLIVILLSFIVIASVNAVAQNDAFEPLHSLAGTWTMKTPRGLTAERWQKVTDAELKGVGFRVSGKDTTIIEYFRIVKRADGIFYQAMVTNQNDGQTVEFKLTSTQNGIYIFANPQHDFPNQIVYQIPAGDSLHAWVTGKIEGKERRIDYRYMRQK